MARHSRLLAIHLIIVLLPCAVIGLLGYKWLELEREAEGRRGRDAAEVEVKELRQDLLRHLDLVTAGLAQKWSVRVKDLPPFAPTPPVPDMIESVCLLTSDSRLIYPDYESAYREAIRRYQSASEGPEWQRGIARPELLEARGLISQARSAAMSLMPQAASLGLESSVLLQLGRLALAEGKYPEAEMHAQRVLACCAGARDEFGVPASLYAANQIVSAWASRGMLQAKFPQLASQMAALLESGWIGHPEDLPGLTELVKRVDGNPAAGDLLIQAERTAQRVALQMALGKRLEKLVSGFTSTGRSPAHTGMAILWSGEKPQLVAVQNGSGTNLLAALLSTTSLAAWIRSRATERAPFNAHLVPAGTVGDQGTLRTALLPEAPAFDLVLEAKESDPAMQQRRRRLFVGALVASVLMVMLVGYFALRDSSRELRLANLRSNFVAGITHDLKTPLTSIRMLAETLYLGRTCDPAVAGQLLGTIVNESERLTRLLDNVLMYAKIEKGKQQYRLERIDLSATVLAAAKRFDPVLEQEGFHITTEADGEEQWVMADRDALVQALLNLLSNAVKYSGTSREIGLSVRALGGDAEICVTDWGRGIPRSEQGRIFESFYRSPEAALDTSGAGLGLALVRHFAESHGGRVSVSSELGKGSAFSLWLPLLKTQRHQVADLSHPTL